MRTYVLLNGILPYYVFFLFRNDFSELSGQEQVRQQRNPSQQQLANVAQNQYQVRVKKEWIRKSSEVTSKDYWAYPCLSYMIVSQLAEFLPHFWSNCWNETSLTRSVRRACRLVGWIVGRLVGLTFCLSS